MNRQELQSLGIVDSASLEKAYVLLRRLSHDNWSKTRIENLVKSIALNPKSFLSDNYAHGLASALVKNQTSEKIELRASPVPFKIWGDENIDKASREQLTSACSLPISVRGALMPDAHSGYGLPIGGVLAVKNAVIPYAVGVDIACIKYLHYRNLYLAIFDFHD